MRFCRLVTLDVMGTLMDVKVPVGISYSKVAAKHGLHVSPDVLTVNFKKVWNEMRLEHPNYGLYSGIGWEKWWSILVHKTFQASLNNSIDNETLNKVANTLINAYNRPDQWKYCNGALDLLNHCTKQQIPLGVLSNFDKRLEELLERMGCRKYFRFVVASYTVGFEKPDKRIFKITEQIAKNCDDLSDIKSNEILHVGDTPELDFFPAKNAGWKAFLVNNETSKIIKKHPEICEKFIFNNLCKVKEVL